MIEKTGLEMKVMDDILRDSPCYQHFVPNYFIKGPHLVHLDGLLAQPGRHNDYTIYDVSNEDSAILWWNPAFIQWIADKSEVLISVTRLDTGERWAYSTVEGVYVDTRKD